MARLPRAVAPGHVHLVIQRGHNGQAVFVDATDADAYLQSLRASLKDHEVSLYAYGLHTREVRLLLSPAEGAGLSALMQSVGRRYVRVFNLRHGRTGTPWEGRFRSTIIEPETYFLACMRFVEAAAERGAPAGLFTETPFHSSAESHLGLRSDAWLTRHPVYWALGNTPFEREANYRRFLERPFKAAEQEAIESAALKGWVLGPEAFRGHIAELTGRRTSPAARGRPRKTPAI